MNKTATQPLTTLESLTEDQASTNTSIISMLEPLDTSTIPTFAQLLAEYQASTDKGAVAWNVRSLDPPAQPMATDQPTGFLWPQRLRLSSINLLDGDHGTGRSLLASQIAACVSSGSPMPDGSSTLQGGVRPIPKIGAERQTLLFGGILFSGSPC